MQTVLLLALGVLVMGLAIFALGVVKKRRSEFQSNVASKHLITIGVTASIALGLCGVILFVASVYELTKGVM